MIPVALRGYMQTLALWKTCQRTKYLALVPARRKARRRRLSQHAVGVREQLRACAVGIIEEERGGKGATARVGHHVYHLSGWPLRGGLQPAGVSRRGGSWQKQKTKKRAIFLAGLSLCCVLCASEWWARV